MERALHMEGTGAGQGTEEDQPCPSLYRCPLPAACPPPGIFQRDCVAGWHLDPSGTIKSGPSNPRGGDIGASSLVRTLEQAMADDKLKAIVLAGLLEGGPPHSNQNTHTHTHTHTHTELMCQLMCQLLCPLPHTTQLVLQAEMGDSEPGLHLL